MKAFMNVSQTKFFSTVLRFMARIGNELYIEATKNGLVLRTLNSSGTCYSSVFFLEHFFVGYQTTGDEYEDNNCRIAMRAILNVLKNYKTFIQCQLKIDSKKERLIVDVTKPKDIHNINYLTILENGNLEDMNIPKEVSTLICQPSVLTNVLNTMTSKSIREVTFKVSQTNFEVRNHIYHPDKDVQTVRLKYIIDSSEFTSYDVLRESFLIVPAVDLQAIAEFAEGIKEELKILFTENGKPLTASVLASDGTARIQMFVSSMLEKDLNKPRNLPATTSYKEVVNTYLESRKCCEVSKLSESEIHRTMSPSVGTFGSNLMTSVSDLRLQKTNPQKRKSNDEFLPQDFQDFDASNLDVPASFEKMKKQKLDQVLNQEEQEVSQIIADLENMDNVEDLRIENLPRNTSSLNFLVGMEKFKVPRVNCDSSDYNATQGSSRFDVSKARFVTEDVIQDSQDEMKNSSENSDDKNRRSKLKTVNENKKHTKKTSSEKLKISSTNREMKNLFAPVLNTNLSLNLKCGNLQVLRSDSESDGD